MKIKSILSINFILLCQIVSAQSGNTFTGTNSGTNNTGSYNSAYGQNSLRHNEGNHNSSFGFQALSNYLYSDVSSLKITGDYNCAFGVDASKSNTSGSHNSSFGAKSLELNSTGKHNSAFGYKAMGSVINPGSFNIAVGYGSLLRNVGDYNIAIGYESPRHLLSGSKNIFIGNETALNLTSGSGNVFIGNKIQLGQVPSNATMAGNDTQNTIIISNGLGAQRIFVHSNGYTGIGLGDNVIPSNRLEIRHGSNGFSGLRFTNLKNSNNPIPNPTSKVLSVDANGDVILVNDMVGTGTTNQTTISAGENITVSGDPTSGYVINSTANSCNLFSCDGTIDTSLGGTNNPNSGLRTITMGGNNLHFLTNTVYEDNTVGSGRIYIGGTLNFPNFNGNNSHYRLLVEGGILTEKVKIALSNTADWADYVFSDEYKLMPLNEVEMFIKENNHLPGIKSAKDLVETGLDVSEMQSKQMEKIEELTLYVIEQNKKLEKQNEEIEELKAIVEKLQKNR